MTTSLREFLGALDLLPPLAAEGLEEGNEVGLLLIGELERLHALIEMLVSRINRALKRGNRFGDVVDRQLPFAKGLLEHFHVTANALEAFDDRRVGGVGVLLGCHFNRVGNRSLGLLFERSRPPVPELPRAVRPVDDGWRAAAPLLPADAGCDRRAIGTCFLWRM